MKRTNRTTTNLRLLKGTNQAVRHGKPGQQVRAPQGRPRCPQWLPEYARAEWRRVLPLLDEMGVLSKSDQTVITQYCLLAGDLRLASEGKRMRTVVTRNGEKHEISEPFSGAEHTQLRLCAQQLGLTVLARQSIKTTGKRGNPFAELEAGR